MNYILLIKTLIAAIKDVETLMPASAGKDKFDTAIAIVESIVGDVSPMLDTLKQIATNVVNALRIAGLFKTTAAN